MCVVMHNVNVVRWFFISHTDNHRKCDFGILFLYYDAIDPSTQNKLKKIELILLHIKKSHCQTTKEFFFSLFSAVNMNLTYIAFGYKQN